MEEMVEISLFSNYIIVIESNYQDILSSHKVC